MASASSQSSGCGSASASATATNSNDAADAEADNGVVNPKYPLWAHATKVSSDPTGRGGNKRFRCNFCDKTYPGSYTRVKSHLLQRKVGGVGTCDKLPHHIFEQLRKDDEQACQLIRNGVTNRTLPLPPFEGSGPSPSGSSRKRKATKQQGIVESFDLETKQQADALIARMYFTGGVPFNLARNPYYRASYNFIANNNMGGYVPPGYNSLRTTLLEKEKKHTERMLEPIKSTWPLKGVTICTDGWSDPHRRPLLNFMAVTEGGPIFIKAIDTAGQIKSTQFIFDRIKEVIEEVGVENVVQVITDNAANCKSAGLMIEAKYKNIYWTPCIVHTLNLALHDICYPKTYEGDNKPLWFIREIADEASFIKNYIMNHGMRLSMFNEFCKLKFLQIAETRFASIVIMLKRFLDIKEDLIQMVVHQNWASYKELNAASAQRVKELILNDVWWDKLTYIVSFLLPMYNMIRISDTDKPCLHLIYEMWDNMIEKVKIPIFRHEGKGPNEDCALYTVIKNMLLSRWTKSNTPLHCLAHSCNPRYYTPSWIGAVEGRVAPHDDKEILDMRNKCLLKFFPDRDDYKTIKKEFADFSLMSNDFLNADSIEDREDFEPKQWWGTHGGSTKLLKKLALKLLGQPSSSSCCERNWSTYAFIHSSARNKLTPARAEDLVFTHSNHRLLSRHAPEYANGPSRMWDVGGDGVETFSGLGVLEGAVLSLDEPILEQQMLEELS